MPTAARAERWRALGERAFDVLVIGGGITGSGVARAAALRGLSVALVEQGDLASGTSSRSSRLVHGGVRYLEHGHVHLVFESSAERRRLLRLAPHLVRPLEFTWPVYRGARIPRWKLGAGLTLYDALALFRNVGRHRRLSRTAVLEREPALKPDGLLGGAIYFDARTNDARLTLANAIGATQAGAVVMNHARAGDLSYEHGRVSGADVTDAITGCSTHVRAAIIVQATGPWTGDVRGSKGTHIAVPRDRIGNRHAVTLLSPTDGRVLFTLPADTHAIIGTTDTFTKESPNAVHASNEDVDYLLRTANDFFPAAKLTAVDVVSAWAGIRPLIPTNNDTPGGATREHLVSTTDAGVVTITGGKLTTYRVMANDALDAVANRLGRKLRPDSTGHTPLPGGDFSSLVELTDDAEHVIGNHDLAAHLAATYGTRWQAVWSDVGAPGGAARIDDALPYVFGEMRYSVREELACTLGDLLLRRTHLAFETRDHGAAAAERVAAVVGPLLGWDLAQTRRALDDYTREAEGVFAINPSTAS
jgi:glycerol-3-phosphate dehydrogenase